MNTSELLAKHAELWHEATHHPFLDGVRSGELPESAFETWLAQDYQFVATAFRAQCRLTAQAPRADQSLLVGGLAALATELDWFEGHLRARGLPLDAPLQPTNRAYGDFLIVMADAVYPAALIVAAIAERAYLDAWSGARPAAPAYAEFVERWTSDGFRAYVDDLARAADRVLASASPEERRQAEEAFVWTARYEAAFWQMAFGSTSDQ